MTEDQIRELFREMRDEPVPPDSRARVRLAVAERSQSWVERFRSHWRIAAAVLAPVCVVLIVFMHGPETVAVKPPALPPAIALAEVPAPAFPGPPVYRMVRHVVRPRRLAPLSAPPPPRQSVNEVAATVIRIETPDPDIVIVLVGG